MFLNRRYKVVSKLKLSTFVRSHISSVLGIETSCDDTGCAIVNSASKVVCEAIHSQQLVHLRNGGIIPPVAQNLHLENIEPVVDKVLNDSGMNIEDLNAIAVTVKPGLPLSLAVGLKYAKYLCRTYSKPLIPIHHMEAHALTIRLLNKDVKFPFLSLLISGGHCILCFIEDVDKFYKLGESIDDAPGEAFDKTARRMKLRNIPELSTFSGGRAIEIAASKASGASFEFPLPLANYRDCNFSFTGLKNSVLRKLMEKEKEHSILGDGVIPEINELCASFQLAIARHLCHRTQRAMEFLDKNNMTRGNKFLVVSGGVACNNFIFKCLQTITQEYNYTCLRPPPNLCTDNGVMIAWNGIEKWNKKLDIIENYEDMKKIDIESNSPVGISLIDEVKKADILTKAVKIKELTD